MANSGVPIGSALPQPRSQVRLVEAAAPSASRNPSGSIIVPQARDRALEFFEREWVPDQTRTTMGGALYGDLDSMHKLMRAMVDTWPRLQSKMDEVKRLVRNAPWKAYPWAKRGEEPSTQSEAIATEFEDAIWQMRPVPHKRLVGFEGMIEALVEGYYFGHQVIEPVWTRDESGWRPTSARVIPPRYYGYPGVMDGDDQLMLDRTGNSNFFSGETFDDSENAHRFIVAIRSSHSGHPATGAPLRALVPYWLAVTYGLKWAMLFSQLFGVPFRWATYADDSDKAAVESMMANIGTAGWAAFKQGTEMEILNSGSNSSALPQWKLIELANQECDIFMLGQTLTSSVGDSGSRALGDVHADVRKDVVAGVCDFAGEAISHQLIPSWAWFNYGSSRADLPGWWAKEDKPKDEKALAERDEILRRAFPELKWSEAQIRERHGVDAPIDDDDELESDDTGEDDQQSPPLQDQQAPEPDDEGDMEEDEEDQSASMQIAAADAPKPTIDQLSAAVLEGLTGVSQEWLAPVKPLFMRLMALAQSDLATDEDFRMALEKAQREMPEAFDILNTEALQTAFERAIASAALAGSVSRYE